MEDEGIFVGSGDIRVDKTRALEILQKYQVPDAGYFAASWVRCAVAADAQSIHISGDKSEFNIKFKGKSFTRSELEHLYDGLLGQQRNDRLKELGLGVLTALRSTPRKITLRSGGTRLEVSEVGKETISPTSGDHDETAISVWWKSQSPDWRTPLTAERVCALTPCPVWIEESQLQRLPPSQDSLNIQKGEANGWVCPWPFSEDGESRLWIYRHGVLVQELSAKLPLPVLALVSDAKLKLNASQTGIIRNQRWEKLLRLLAREQISLLEPFLKEQKNNFADIPQQLTGTASRQAWSSRGSWQNILSTPEGWSSTPLKERPLARAGIIADWLHQCAANLLGSNEWIETVPLLLMPDGGTASLREVRATQDRLGSVPFSRQRKNNLETGTVWCPSPRDLRWLRLHFGHAVREV
ncbi:MAG: hypothetical protein COB53_06510 [Elusimicrobia bacterium]|nr:MAG: hypothetical protein COB53_06510 [Elusimicrobiota bacterium]